MDDPGPTVSLPPRRTPPYDRLPGRTPIPVPAQTGDGLSGPLPAIGGLDKRAAAAAVDLVLGRYCLDPEAAIRSPSTPTTTAPARTATTSTCWCSGSTAAGPGRTFG